MFHDLGSQQSTKINTILAMKKLLKRKYFTYRTAIRNSVIKITEFYPFNKTLCVFSSKSNIKREDDELLGLQDGQKISTTLYFLKAEKGEVGGLRESLKDSNFTQNLLRAAVT